MRAISQRTRMLIAIAIVPACALSIALRQAYLSTCCGLSTWKGGGMGMFAAADQRFARIYVEMPDGSREPIIGLTDEQRKLVERGLLYPVKSSFEPVVSSIRNTNWQNSNNPLIAVRVDADGNRVGTEGRPFYVLNAAGMRTPNSDPISNIVIEYWSASYDPHARVIQGTLIDTIEFQ